MTDDSLVFAIQEELRRQTLDEYEIVDTGHEQDFDDLAALASYICGTPISAISLIDRDRQWFKASVGLDDRETPRDISFCQYTVGEDDLFVVPDALEDDRFKESPLVVDGPRIRFYAGAPLIAPNGSAVGALCVKDVQPRELSEDQLDALRRLARQVVAQLELRKMNRGLTRQTSMLQRSTADLQAANATAQAAHREIEAAVEELREGQARFDLICNATNDVVWDLNLTTGQIWVSDNYHKKFLGMSEGYVPTTQDWEESIHPDDRDRVLVTMRECLTKSLAGWTEEYRHIRFDGTYVEVLDRAFLILDGSGCPARMVGAMMDITQRKQAEADERAREQAERANEAKNQFLSRMSHELRTPLNSVLGFAQLLEIYDPTPRQTECIEQIMRGGKHLLGLINEILDLTRIESGNLTISREPVSVFEVAQEAISLVQPIARERSIEVTLRPDEEDRYVFADRQRLLQIMINLLSNGVKYNVEAGRVEVSCVENEGRISISVKDTGNGIGEDLADRVFRPFDRLGADLRGVIEGTGLGLALSKNLAEAMDGTLSFQSVVGKGTEFSIDLPVAEKPSLNCAAMPETVALGEDAVARTVLYIEDNKPNLALMEQVFATRPDWKLITTTKGFDGLSIASGVRPDLILLDLDLPDISGLDVLLRFRSQPQLATIPILIVSADATPERVRRLEAAGADGYITKPFDMRDLMTRIDATYQLDRDHAA